MTAALSPHTTSRLWLPRSALSACLRAVLTRDTVGADLSVAQRYNHFPASPLCSLTLWWQGCAQMLPPDHPGHADALHAPIALSAPLPRLLLAGPFTRPLVSWNPGPMRAMLLLIQPDALHRLTGLAVADWVNRWDDARAVLPADWLALCQSLLDDADADDATHVQRLQDFLEPRWQAVRPNWPMQAQRYGDWAQSLALHAALSAPGRSLRQMERRIKRWAGLPLRELRGLGRSEQTFFNTLAATENGPPNWAELADASGYADQSHLCRETRRVTGFSPDELYRRILGDESFWSYRLWQ